MDQIIIDTKSHTKHEYKKVMKNFGSSKDIRTGGSIKMVSWTKGHTHTIINFTKVGSRWYAYSFSNGLVGVR